MKFNSLKAIQKALFLITSILTLNACGSGAAEESDTIAPVINVQVADTTVWAQSDVKFDISVTDNKDSTISYTLNCNAGETSGAILSTPNVSEITDISCQITARDSAGNSGLLLSSRNCSGSSSWGVALRNGILFLPLSDSSVDFRKGCLPMLNVGFLAIYTRLNPDAR